MNDDKLTDAFVLVFKTNINTPRQVKSIGVTLDHCPEILKWNVDLADIDRVLRIEATHAHCGPVIELVRRAGYACEELTD
ncbi:hypothetical protein GCM10010967_27010 [Dyadobacter beijingensis]|uniref:Copper chaperone CopZ n=1 Tax=Dyadobacter beijingensis TaxID=365489 RepID=A0ABQ2HV18_9BACT|nr:hypothetical protein [Dyadobacter beijingensis]GGM92418.1 hypothetical protein GCM10010967_27010 [Dyadobacter beijingensis]